MGVSTILRKEEYSGPIVPTSNLTVPFKFLADIDIMVEISDLSNGANSVTWLLNTDYTLVGAGGDSGTLTTITDVPSDKKLTVFRQSILLRIIDYIQGGQLDPEVLDSDVDAVILMIQELDETIGRALLTPITGGGATITIPPFIADEYWAYDGIGNLVTTPGPVIPALTGSPVYRETVTFPTTQTVFNLSFSSGSKDDLAMYRNGQYIEATEYTLTSPTQVTMLGTPFGTTKTETLEAVPRNIISQSADLADFGTAVGGTGPTFKQPNGTNRIMSVDDNNRIKVGSLICALLSDITSTFKTGTTVNRSTAYPTPLFGDWYYDTDLAELQYYDGAAFVTLASDTSVFHKATAGEITALTEKTLPVPDDVLLIEDSADSNNKKKVKVSALISSGVKAYTGAGKTQSNSISGNDDFIITHTITGLPTGNNIIYGFFSMRLSDSSSQGVATFTVGTKEVRVGHDSTETIEVGAGGGLGMVVQNGTIIKIEIDQNSGGTSTGEFDIQAYQEVGV